MKNEHILKLDGYSKEQVALMTEEERGKLAHAYHQQLVNQLIQMRKNFLVMGKILYEIEYLELYKPYHETFEEYLTSPELDLSRSWAYMLIGIHRHYVIAHECDVRDLIEIGPKKLNLLKSKTDDENIDELLARAKTLSYDDLKVSFNERDINDSYGGRMLEPGYYRLERVEPEDGDELFLGSQMLKFVRNSLGVLAKVE